MIFESYRGMFRTADWDRVSVPMVEVDGVWIEGLLVEHRFVSPEEYFHGHYQGSFDPGLDVESYEDYLKAKNGNGKRRF